MYTKKKEEKKKEKTALAFHLIQALMVMTNVSREAFHPHSYSECLCTANT
jgi:hypothetical protein